MEDGKKEHTKSKIAEREEEILKFWKENNIFEKSLEKDSPQGDFIFYEGPPTANAKPALHHLEARAFKDIIPRYKTMRGYHVPRKGGWDTHGLPVELQIEKKLGLTSKKDIENYGVEKFNSECKKSVFEYIGEWEKFTDRIAYWVDKENAYYTFDASFMEAVWGVVKHVSDKGLLYKDYRVVPWCTRCGTALSSHELAQGYDEVSDISVYVKFKIKAFPNAYFLAWTTTPWTLPGNVGLAINKDFEYVEAKVKTKSGEEIFVLAKDRLSILSEEYEVIATHKGSEMVGMEYEPMYPFLNDLFKDKNKETFEKAYKIYEADFVNTEDGTGIVHTAVMYGQEDFELGTKVGLPKHHLVSLEGKFVDGTGFLAKKYVRDLDTTIEILRDLENRNILLKKEKYKHSYPHCWRCKTALIYYARDSWYIKMSSLRSKLQEENQKINWVPEHIKEGRFGEWLREVKDWAISRERYWGTPLPIWQNSEGKKIVIGSVDDLKKYTKKSLNKYFIMRHGEAEHNVLDICSSDPNNQHHLTEKGKENIKASIENLKDVELDLIIRSPFVRAKETSTIVAEYFGLSDDQIIEDTRISEFNFGKFNLHPFSEYIKYREGHEFDMDFKIPDGESLQDAKNRFGEFLYDLENKYKDKKILIVTHGIGLQVLPSIINGMGKKESANSIRNSFRKIPDAYLQAFDFVPLPHNHNYELDLHKPYIDEIELFDEEGGSYKRTGEVMDVWFDSGAMPFAQNGLHNEILYPADYISEAIDQTRGWFYTLHAIGTLMDRGLSYKNVVCLGHILDAEGKKMSKSIGNIIDPVVAIDTYGSDILRMWMYTVNQPGDSKNFDPKTVDELTKKTINVLENIISFYEMYADASIKPSADSDHVLDIWIISAFNKMLADGTKYLDQFKIFEASRLVKDFINDFSTWYIRRSRDRFKSEDSKDRINSLSTTAYVLLELSKYMAPFMPFFAEYIYLKFRNENDPLSVHLANWPHVIKTDNGVLENMEVLRGLVSLALEKRMDAKIKVRQPLSMLKIKDLRFKNADKEIINLIKDEVNIKEVVFDESIIEEVELDTTITESLKEEGDVREIVRMIQDLRKEKSLTPDQKIKITVESTKEILNLFRKFEQHISKPTNISTLEYIENDKMENKIDGLILKIGF